MVKVLLILAILVLVGLAGWYIFSPERSSDINTASNNDSQVQTNQDSADNSYKILATENYLCTKSIPAQCSGTIKVQDSSGRQKTVEISRDTNFNGADPGDLYQANRNPLDAELLLEGNFVENLKLL